MDEGAAALRLELAPEEVARARSGARICAVGLELEVKLFAGVREALGRESVRVRLEEAEPRVADLLDRLAAEHPEIERRRASLGVAVNQELALPKRALQAGDEVALIPPLGGG